VQLRQEFRWIRICSFDCYLLNINTWRFFSLEKRFYYKNYYCWISADDLNIFLRSYKDFYLYFRKVNRSELPNETWLRLIKDNFHCILTFAIQWNVWGEEFDTRTDDKTIIDVVNKSEILTFLHVCNTEKDVRFWWVVWKT